MSDKFVNFTDEELDWEHEELWQERGRLSSEFNAFDYWDDGTYSAYEREIRDLSARIEEIETEITRRIEEES